MFSTTKSCTAGFPNTQLNSRGDDIIDHHFILICNCKLFLSGFESQQYSKHLSSSIFYFGFISQFCHQNWDSNSEEKTESTVKTEQIIFPLHIIYLTEGSKRRREHRKNLSLSANLSFALCSSILSAPLNLVLPQTGQQRPSAIGNKWSGRGGATTHGRRFNSYWDLHCVVEV